MRTGIERVGDGEPDPWWRDAVPTFRRTEGGWRFDAPVADMSAHLPWLGRRLEALGGAVGRATLASVDDALAHAPVVVNCAGLGARELAGDGTLVAVRGQILRVEARVDEWLLDQTDPEALLYVVPRERDVVLGGTAVEGDEDPRPDAAVAAEIRARCEAAMPALRGARVVGEAVGLRPGRPAVRLEAEVRDSGTVVHCYGHGGAGVTLAWGCAEEVVGLTRRALG
jgi:D-amino-acid oxidase